MSASNEEVINALASIANFTLTDKTSFGALFGGSNGGSSNVASAKGVGNTSFGNSALSGLIDTSKQNTAFGHRSQLSTESDSNTSFGFESMLFNWMGSENTAFGAFTFDNLTLGCNNVAFGFQAGKNVSIGNGNIFIGNGAGVSLGNINNSIVIGNDAQANKDNQMVIGSATCEAGEVKQEQLNSTNTWSVVINGIERKILLA
jgi:hypothetical protein